MTLIIKDETGKEVAHICEMVAPNVVVSLIQNSNIKKNLTLFTDDKGRLQFTVTNTFQGDFIISILDKSLSESVVENEINVMIICHMGYTITCI